MPNRYRTIDAARAADLERRQLEVLITRDVVKPDHTPELGEARLFAEEEIVRLAVLGELLRLGIPATRVAPIAREFYFLNKPFALVVWHGFAELIPSSPRGTKPPAAGGPNAVYVRPQDFVQGGENQGQMLSHEAVPMDGLAEFLAQPRVAAATVVPIDRIEARVKARLAKATVY